MKSPLLALAVCFALGIGCAAYMPAKGIAPLEITALLIAAGALACLVGLMALRRGGTWMPMIAVLAGCFAAGAAAEILFPFRFPPDHISRIEERGVDPGRDVLLEGRMATGLLREPDGTEFDLEVAAIEQEGRREADTGRVRLWVEAPFGAGAESLPDLQPGDWIRVNTRLRRPKVYQNPGAFDYRGWLESIHDIYWVGNVRGAGGIEKIPAPESSRSAGMIPGVRRRGLRAIDRMYPPWGGGAKDGAVLKAVLFGDRTALDSETVENFRKTGLYHLLVVAGLHVGLVAFLAALLFGLLPLGETARSSLVLSVVVAYALLVDVRAPTLRATIMIAAYLVGRMVYRERALLNAVGLAALALLFVRPAWLFEAGFDLSFSAALLIAGLAVPILDKSIEPFRTGLYHVDDTSRDIGLAPRIAQFRIELRMLASALEIRFPVLLHRRAGKFLVMTTARVLIWCAEGLLFSLILQLGLVLPMVAVFHRVTLAGVGLNALALPLMALVLAVAIPSVALVALAPSLAPVPAAVLGLVLRLLFALTDIPHLPVWLSYRLPGPPLWAALGFAISLVFAAWAWRHRPRIFAASVAAFSVFLILVSTHPFAPLLPSGVMEITALDCGEGDATFIVLPDRTTALINSCGARERNASGYSRSPWSAGEDIVSPYLWSRGIERLDLVALTESPGRQRRSVEDVARNFKVGRIWLNTADATPETYALQDDLRRGGSQVLGLEGGERLPLGGGMFRVLWPAGGDAQDPSRPDADRNDSMVVRITEGEASALLAGGFREDARRALAGEGEMLRSPLLEIRSSRLDEAFQDGFVRAVSPEIVWTDGQRSRPRDSVRTEIPHFRIFHTAADGAIEITEDRDRLTVRLYRSSSTGWAAGSGAGWLLASTSSSVP